LENGTSPKLEHGTAPKLEHGTAPKLEHSIAPKLEHSIAPKLEHGIALKTRTGRHKRAHRGAGQGLAVSTTKSWAKLADLKSLRILAKVSNVSLST
jgi:hypothetical protein